MRRLLDLGCGNGYELPEWAASGLFAVGVDNSPYRFERWVRERNGGGGARVLADAEHLPFRQHAFGCVVSSGMIEHIGVHESRPPYQVRRRPDRDERRAVVLSEMLRLAHPEGIVLLDFPNGAFPVDFWHGDRVGSLRRHPIPDDLNPTYADIVVWSAGKAEVRLLPLAGRLRYRQVARWWWGRLFRPLMAAFIGTLDALRHLLPARLLSRLYPFVVVSAVPSSGPPRDPPPS